MPGEGTVIWMDGDPRIRVMEMSKQKFDAKHDQALHIDNTTFMVKNTQQDNGWNKMLRHFGPLMVILGIFRIIISSLKNDKYYYVLAWAYTGWDSSKQSRFRQHIDKAVKSIVSTIT